MFDRFDRYLRTIATKAIAIDGACYVVACHFSSDFAARPIGTICLSEWAQGLNG
jgi:hypothetical protein